MQSLLPTHYSGKMLHQKNQERIFAAWRNGPAQFWYDMLNVSQTGEGFDYGFKVKKESTQQRCNRESDFPDESFLLVAQNTWEDDIIWDDDSLDPNEKRELVWSSLENQADNESYSIFPVENEELVYGLWEDEIIWDSEAVPHIPKPRILTLDPNDENIILGIPDDMDLQKQHFDVVTPARVKVTHPHIKKSKLLLGKAGVINILKDDASSPSSKSLVQDPFNISNDGYYYPQSSEVTLKLKMVGANLIQHSTPVVELRAPFIQTRTELVSAKNIHRPPLRRYSTGVNAHPGPHPVMSLTNYIDKKFKIREQERITSGGGDMFFMRTPEDLTGRDGELILIEFCEENPPLVNQVGMCSRVRNYYKRKASKDEGPMHFRFGEVAYAHTSPFLGSLSPGQSIQVIENNMYSAPIYEHRIQETDFLIIRTRNKYFVREFNAIFTAGQLCPLHEVPGPNSKQANQFIRDLLQVFIYRLFWRNKDTPKRIRMDDIKRAFPSHTESSIRKRLKMCANFKRTGNDSNWWVIKPDFRLPPEEEIRTIVSPEQYCAYFSMIAASQRLKDAGYGEKSFFIPEDDDENFQLKMDDEEKLAPWNTTRAYIQAIKGKCFLQLTGPTEPTGCGEGFSYVRMPIKPVVKQGKEQSEIPAKRMVTGTDADLRKLPLEKAKSILRDCGIPEDDMKKLSRWEVIDLVRTVSTERAKIGIGGMTKYSRGNRFSAAEQQERYKEECQRIFDLQNRVLSSAEVLSTDEGETSNEEDSFDIEEMGKNIENMLTNKKMISQIYMEQEEQERQELCRLMLSNDNPSTKNKMIEGKRPSANNTNQFCGNRLLKIYRTFQDSEGKEFTRMEIVRNQMVIDAYLKLKTTKNESLMKKLTAKDTLQKEEIRRQKRRMQEQLRRNKRNITKKSVTQLDATKITNVLPSSSLIGLPMKQLNEFTTKKEMNQIAVNGATLSRKSRPSKIKSDLKVRCGACGATGHMRTNRACPQHVSYNVKPISNVALTRKQEDNLSKLLNENTEDLINLEGTKVKISGKFLKLTDDVKRRALQLKFPRETVIRKRRKFNTDCNHHLDYLKKQSKRVNRRRTDPLVELSTVLELILSELRTLPGVQPFMFPVSAKSVPDYLNIVNRPMDLQTIRENLRQKKYQTREDFLCDINQILENSALYNGAKSQLTLAAKGMLDVCVDRLAQNEDRLMTLEKMINPLLDDDDQVALSFILSSIIDKLTMMSESWPFAKPVNKHAVKDYYNVVEHPMDLETIRNNIKVHKYHSREAFLNDIRLIFDNCIVYNGQGSSYSARAEKVLNAAKACLKEYDEHISILEQNIELVQRKAVIESLSTSWCCVVDNYNEEHLKNVSSDSRSQIESKEHEDVRMECQRSVIKAEILADDLCCSSEDGDEVQNNVIEKVSNDLVNSKYYVDQLAANIETGYPYFPKQNLRPSVPTDNSFSTSLPDEDNFILHKDELQNDFDQYQEMMNSLSYQAIDADFDMIGLEESGERLLNVEDQDVGLPSYMITSATEEEDVRNSLWF